MRLRIGRGGWARPALIRTHGRAIEDRLFHLFTAADWRLEDDKACRMRPNYRPGDPSSLKADGGQLWLNCNPLL